MLRALSPSPGALAQPLQLRFPHLGAMRAAWAHEQWLRWGRALSLGSCTSAQAHSKKRATGIQSACESPAQVPLRGESHARTCTETLLPLRNTRNESSRYITWRRQAGGEVEATGGRWRDEPLSDNRSVACAKGWARRCCARASAHLKLAAAFDGQADVAAKRVQAAAVDVGADGLWHAGAVVLR